MAMLFCLSVHLFACLSVASEICKLIHYMAVPGGKWGLIMSTQIHLFAVKSCTGLRKNLK